MPKKEPVFAECITCGKTKFILAKKACRACYTKYFRPLHECANCHKKSKRHGSTADRKPLCKACFAALDLRPREKCCKCGLIEHVATRNDKYEAICLSCYQSERVEEKCQNCGDMAPIITTTADDKRVCKRCYVALGLLPEKECDNCHKVLPVSKNVDNKPICRSCYDALELRPTRPCSVCTADLETKAFTDSGEPLCRQCYDKSNLRPLITCANCKEQKIRNGVTLAGQAVCGACYFKLQLAPRRECSRCHNVKRQCGIAESGPVCRKCYHELGLQPKHECTKCKRVGYTYGLTDDGEPLCRNCYPAKIECEVEGCDKLSKTQHEAKSHARQHGPWRGKSTMEEFVYSVLIAGGFRQTWASLDPVEGPSPGTFWYNSRPFSKLVGVGNRRLECDFLIGLTAD